MKRLIIAGAMLTALPAHAEEEPFFTLANSHTVVLIAFVIFVGALFYLGVPKLLTGLLDKRAAQIRSDLEEARAVREEAKAILATYERKKKDVQDQSDRIVAAAKEEAKLAAAEAKEELKRSIARRLAAAEDRIASAEKTAIREVRERAVTIAVAAAADILAKQMTAEAAAKSIDASILQVGAKLH